MTTKYIHHKYLLDCDAGFQRRFFGNPTHLDTPAFERGAPFSLTSLMANRELLKNEFNVLFEERHYVLQELEMAP